jgi:hypothetical protein
MRYGVVSNRFKSNPQGLTAIDSTSSSHSARNRLLTNTNALAGGFSRLMYLSRIAKCDARTSAIGTALDTKKLSLSEKSTALEVLQSKLTAKTVGKSAEYAVASSLSGYFYMNLPGTLYRMAENIVFGQPRTHAEFDAAETPTKPSDSG